MSEKQKQDLLPDRLDALDRPDSAMIASIHHDIMESMDPKKMSDDDREYYELRQKWADEDSRFILATLGLTAAAATVLFGVGMANLAERTQEDKGVVVHEQHIPVVELPVNPADMVVTVHRYK